MKWKRKVKQVFAMMLAVATLLSGCAPNGIVFRWGYTCDYTQQGGAGNPFFMRFLSTVLGSSPVYRFFNAAESHKMWGSAVFCVSKILQTDVDSINVLLLFGFWLTGTGLKKYLPVIVASALGFFFSGSGVSLSSLGGVSGMYSSRTLVRTTSPQLRHMFLYRFFTEQARFLLTKTPGGYSIGE